MANLLVKCPTCDKAVAWAAPSKFRPFCSDRCRLIDLGAWADGKRYIPSDAEHGGVTESDIHGQDPT
jgi:endogenous inhibitor of DNA gyrase (YacG/DUF329 family)